LQPQPVFLKASVVVEPIEKLAVGIATVIQESQRGGRLEHASAGQFHAVAGILGFHREYLTDDLAHDHVGSDPPTGENALADVGFSDPDDPGEPVRRGILGTPGTITRGG